MKKIWTKFKHWIIHKLGGFVTPIRPVDVCTIHKEIITLESKIAVSQPSLSGYDNIKNNNIEWFKENCPRDVLVLKGSIADKIFDLDEEVIDIDHSWDPNTDRVFLRARIRIAKNN